MKNYSIRIPIYGVFIQICTVLIGSILLSSCVTPRLQKPVQINKPHVYPNIINNLDKLMLAKNDGKNIEYLENLVNQEVEEGSRKFK